MILRGLAFALVFVMDFPTENLKRLKIKMMNSLVCLLVFSTKLAIESLMKMAFEKLLRSAFDLVFYCLIVFDLALVMATVS